MMVFKCLFLAHTPDADHKRHQWVVETSVYKLFVVLVRNQPQALEITKQMLEAEGIHSILLCPGFTHGDVAEIQDAVKGKAGVFVARGDAPSSRIVQGIMEEVDWFKR
ncbi:MAG: DUF6506 family protein [Candidatus Aminicenantales bacterium]